MLIEMDVPQEQQKIRLLKNDLDDLREYLETETNLTTEQINQYLIKTVSHWIKERAEDQRKEYGMEDPLTEEAAGTKAEVDKILIKLGLAG